MYPQTREERYQNGVEFAQEVQEALKQGKTFKDLDAFPPEEAARIRDIAQKHGYRDVYAWYDGYVSRWD